MNKTRYLQIVFDKKFNSWDIPKLRAAIIEKTKRESDLFHNHFDDEKYIYRYPLIQYKIKDKKPCLICLKEATEDIHYLLKERDFTFNINGKKYEFEIEDVRLRYVNIQTWDREFRYNVHNYIALNQENYKQYKTIDSLAERVEFLEEKLYNHIKTFAVEMDAHMPVELKSRIIEIKNEKYIEYKGVFHLTFSLNFKSNLYIPNYVGIGKGTSIGFGIVKMLGDKK